jgi:hypothetical protein
VDGGSIPPSSTKSVVDSNQYSGRVAIFGYDNAFDGADQDFDRAYENLMDNPIDRVKVTKNNCK